MPFGAAQRHVCLKRVSKFKVICNLGLSKDLLLRYIGFNVVNLEKKEELEWLMPRML